MATSSKTIGSYQILSPLGQGGMGTVYYAEHIDTGSSVALKTVRIPHESCLQSIRREIITLARINHPGIIRIIDHGIQEGLPWYAMELLAGYTLRDHGVSGPKDHLGRTVTAGDESRPTVSCNIDQTPSHWWADTLALDRTARIHFKDKSKGRVNSRILPAVLTEEKLLSILTLVQRLCSPLAYLHGEGIVHRDLKPENILVRTNGNPVIVDFGLLTQYGGALSREILQIDGSISGTVRYMAPEQIRGELVDARADLYALGCIMYELLTGVPPFFSATASETLEAHLNEDPTPPSRRISGIPRSLDALILQLLAKDPRDRIGYAADVVSILEGFGAASRARLPGPKPRCYLYRPGFSGRDSQMSVLLEHLNKMKKKSGRCILVGGESGIGKTRLAIECGLKANRQDIMVLFGNCEEEGTRLLQGLRKILQAIADQCREKGAKEVDKLLGPRAKVLAMYEAALANLPGLELYPDPEPLSENMAR
ncbi:protein kinase, partial [candidate division CSSED10-310 bacterium]